MVRFVRRTFFTTTGGCPLSVVVRVSDLEVVFSSPSSSFIMPAECFVATLLRYGVDEATTVAEAVNVESPISLFTKVLSFITIMF